MRRAVLTVFLLILGAARASAGGIESDTRLLLNGGVAVIPAELGTEEERPVFGLGISHRTQPKLLLELRASYITRFKELAAASARSVGHAEGNLTWNPLEQHGFAPFLSAGLGAARIDPADGTHVTRFAWNGGAGAEMRLARKLGFRLEGRALGYKVPMEGSSDKSTLTWEALVGIVIGLGGRPDDFDGDGVPNATDACPDTPVGVRVDAKGCPIDSDGDGVWDGIDTCPDTPKGCTVDAKGCPSDSDGDGVWDGLDLCAGTPAGAKVDPGGCPLDADGDRVADGLDTCPDTPKGCAVDAKGCPADADSDGVCDGIDKCAGTARGVKVDSSGCEAAVLERESELLKTGMIRLENINFNTGTATLSPESYGSLNEVGDILARWPGLRIEIGGHTDDRGSDMQNMKLSKARAKAVLDYLARKFPELDTSGYTVVGYGESQPLVRNDSEVNRAQNRRVEFKVLNPEVLRRSMERKTRSTKE